MTIRDAQGLLGRWAGLTRPVLELGCGPAKRWPGSIGVDADPRSAADLVGSAEDVLAALPDHSVAAIRSSHFLEHVEDFPALLAECCRVLQPGGELEAVVPHFANPYHYSDPTHRRTFGLYSFSYFAEDPIHHRTVPRYLPLLPLRLMEARLVFKAARPFYLRHALLKASGVLFDACRFTRELYEGLYSGWIPCYEIHFRLARTADPAP